MCNLDKYYRKEKYEGTLALSGSSVPSSSVRSKHEEVIQRLEEGKAEGTAHAKAYHRKELGECEGRLRCLGLGQ
jgi:hypothetical protein